MRPPVLVAALLILAGAPDGKRDLARPEPGIPDYVRSPLLPGERAIEAAGADARADGE